jgi:isopenicillin N synthase-like dioxygenase
LAERINKNNKSNTMASESSALSETARERSLLGSGNEAAIDTHHGVPIIDMSLPKDQVIDEMWKAAKDVGFFTVVNHGIAQEDIDSLFQVSETFFSTLSQAEKENQSPFDRSLNSGYEYMAQAPPSTGTTDQKESVQITARQGCMYNRWPTIPQNFQSATENMTQQFHELACTVLSLLEAKACPHLQPGTLANSHHLWNHDGQCTLRLIHYPPMNKFPEIPSNRSWRAGPHTDWGNVTLLFQRLGEAGLECCANPRASDGLANKWIPVPPVHGGIAVNIGDMLMRWSDGRLISNLHRVRMPSSIEECSKSRYSIAFFLQADKSSLIESQNNESITAGEFFEGRIGDHFSSS